MTRTVNEATIGAAFELDPAGRVRVVEVGPRDGLQNERVILPTEVKVQFVDSLSGAGLSEIEVSSFVNPARVPQLADADAVFANLTRRPGVRYTGLVANERGLDRAIAAQADGIAVFTAASEAFALRNIGQTIEGSLEVFRGLVSRARNEGLWVRAYVSTAFSCPFTGPVAPGRVLPIVIDLLEMKVDEVSIGDTIGSARPEDVARLTEALLGSAPVDRLAYHFHDTHGSALENVKTALDYGISVFDSSAGGLGGCPFAPGAPGNLSTEDLLALLATRGLETGVDRDRVKGAVRVMRSRLSGVDNSSRLC